MRDEHTFNYLLDLMKPGLRGQLAKFNERDAARRPLSEEDIFLRDAKAVQWLAHWIPEHRDDFKTTFIHAVIAYLNDTYGCVSVNEGLNHG